MHHALRTYLLHFPLQLTMRMSGACGLLAKLLDTYANYADTVLQVRFPNLDDFLDKFQTAFDPPLTLVSEMGVALFFRETRKSAIIFLDQK